MVAIDQRESLRTILAQARGADVEDRFLVEFKVAVARRLAPYASAMLFDRHYAMPAFRAAAAVAPSCGRILAADALVQEPGGTVQDTEIDEEVDPAQARAQGAAALKLLLIWRGDDGWRCVEKASRFMERCRGAGLIGVVETIVRPRVASRRESTIVDAARRLALAGPDLYKCEVPFGGKAGDAAIAGVCEQVSEVLPCPWVVLSQGVEIPDFPRSVEIACRSGASGFLAGRAIWSDTVASTDYEAQLAAVSVPRLQMLAEIVDRTRRCAGTATPGAAPDD
jgi:sulfofructosephosphate aldolase